MVVTEQEYLERITKPIAWEKFKIYDFGTERDIEKIVHKGLSPINEWFRMAIWEQAGVMTISYVQKINSQIYIILLSIDEFSNVRAMRIIELGVDIIHEIPDKVAEDSLKRLYPIIPPKFPFWILLFTPLLLIPFLLKDKTKI